MSPKVYEADGPVIRKLPVETKTEAGVKISIGFPVCRLTEWCDEQGDAVAEIMNRGEAYASSQAEIERLRTALEFYRDGFQFHTNPRRAGLEWKPTETLLDDCGNVARLALLGSAS